jgi:hypothetical protein
MTPAKLYNLAADQIFRDGTVDKPYLDICFAALSGRKPETVSRQLAQVFEKLAKRPPAAPVKTLEDFLKATGLQTRTGRYNPEAARQMLPENHR